MAPRESGQRFGPWVLTEGTAGRLAIPFPRVRIGATSALRRRRSSRLPPRRAAAFFDAAILAEPARGMSSEQPETARPRASSTGPRNANRDAADRPRAVRDMEALLSMRSQAL